jgi:predicted small secreted protein
MKIHGRIWIVVVATLGLAACQTFSGIQEDFKALSHSVSNTAKSMATSEAPEEAAVAEAMAVENPICPPIIIDPQLSSLTEFADNKNPNEENKVSSMHLVRASSTCTQGEEYLTLQIDLAFDGKLGPKARRKSGDQPFYAYPYFIAVKDNNHNEIVKELFAASVTYNAEQNQQSLIETIRQKLPYNKDGTLPPYQIHVGFQLTQDQLFYNASL